MTSGRGISSPLPLEREAREEREERERVTKGAGKGIAKALLEREEREEGGEREEREGICQALRVRGVESRASGITESRWRCGKEEDEGGEEHVTPRLTLTAERIFRRSSRRQGHTEFRHIRLFWNSGISVRVEYLVRVYAIEKQS
jgi:hypothetical protein